MSNPERKKGEMGAAAEAAAQAVRENAQVMREKLEELGQAVGATVEGMVAEAKKLPRLTDQ